MPSVVGTSAMRSGRSDALMTISEAYSIPSVWRSSLSSAAGETVAHHQVRAAAQLLQHRHHVAEVVAVVGVTHDDEPAMGRHCRGVHGRAIAADGHRHDPRAGATRD